MARLCILATTAGIGLSILVVCSLIRRGTCVIKGLPDCNVRPTTSVPTDNSLPSSLRNNFKELLLVSTLDGHVSALDPNDGGKMLWSHDTGTESMLSSSITRLEMSNKGQTVRLIPSLDGNLYQFNGKTVEPVPMSAETLLKSSFKLGDDVIITGGKDSNSFGISLETGNLRYSCSMQGCHTMGDALQEHEDVLVVRRLTQTVRAVTPRTGEERWNFSVSEHHVTFLAKIEEDCSGGTLRSGYNAEILEENVEDRHDENKEVKVIVPDGVIALVSTAKKHVYWTRKLNAPIVHAWRLKDNRLEPINLFDKTRVMSGKQVENHEMPLLYLGRHQNQLYIQHSGKLQNLVRGVLNQFIQNSEVTLPVIEWKPYVATGQSRTPYINHGKERPALIEDTKINIETMSTALVLKQDDFLDYPYDSGYYLYGSTNLRTTIDNNTSCGKDEEVNDDDVTSDMMENFMRPIFSLWHWWKEVCAISLATSVLFHVLYTRRAVSKIKKKLIEEKSTSESLSSSPSINFLDANERFSKSTSDIPSAVESKIVVNNFLCDYKSRYTTDFEPIQRLGKGGFGVVFEARNKIDDCHYAVKRILLPDRLDAQEKVMREVKALAKLDNTGIVRYFNAWQETPPPGWQEQQDQQWEEKENSQVMSTFNSPSISMTSSHAPRSISPVLIKRRISKVENNPFKVTEGFSSSSRSNNTVTSQNYDDESGSFSFQKELSNNNDSFEIIFQNNPDKSSTIGFNYTSSLCESDSVSNSDNMNQISLKNLNNLVNGDSTNDSNSIEFSQVPFSFLKKSGSLLIKNEDSGCADRSASTDEEFLSLNERCDELKQISDAKMNRPVDLLLAANVYDKPTAQPSLKLYLYIQMQLCRKQTLKDWLVLNITRERDEVLDIFDQIVSAVQYVHDCNMMHRDLKPSNIFFSVDGTVKVGDFGLVTALTESEVHTPESTPNSTGGSSRHTNQVGTQLYMSPEQIAGHAYSHKVDIFSLGLILFELLTPFPTQMERGKVMFNVKKHIFPKQFVSNFPEECALVEKMLSHDPFERPSALEIKKHPLFKEFQPQPELYARHRRRRTLSQRFSSSGSECDSLNQENAVAQEGSVKE